MKFKTFLTGSPNLSPNYWNVFLVYKSYFDFIKHILYLLMSIKFPFIPSKTGGGEGGWLQKSSPSKRIFTAHICHSWGPWLLWGQKACCNLWSFQVLKRNISWIQCKYESPEAHPLLPSRWERTLGKTEIHWQCWHIRRKLIMSG